MIAFRIDLDKINQSRIFTGKTGRRYLSFILIDGSDQYGNAGQVVHSILREERAGGGKGEVVGTWKHLSVTKARSQGTNLFNSLAQAFDAADDDQRKTSS